LPDNNFAGIPIVVEGPFAARPPLLTPLGDCLSEVGAALPERRCEKHHVLQNARQEIRRSIRLRKIRIDMKVFLRNCL